MVCILLAAMIVGRAQPSAASPAPAQPAAAEPATKTAPPKPAASAPITDGATSFEKRLAAVDAKMAAVVDLRADFEQRKKTAMLKKPLISKGSLVCKAGAVLWKTDEPRKSQMLVNSDKVTIYYPADNTAEVYPTQGRFADAGGGPLPRFSRMTESFELSEIDVTSMLIDPKGDTTGRLAVKLTPKTDALKKHVSFVRVLIDERIPCADRVIVTDPDGDETELRFTAIKLNSGVKADEIELELPGGIKVSTFKGP